MKEKVCDLLNKTTTKTTVKFHLFLTHTTTDKRVKVMINLHMNWVSEKKKYERKKIY